MGEVKTEICRRLEAAGLDYEVMLGTGAYSDFRLGEEFTVYYEVGKKDGRYTEQIDPVGRRCRRCKRGLGQTWTEWDYSAGDKAVVEYEYHERIRRYKEISGGEALRRMK